MPCVRDGRDPAQRHTARRSVTAPAGTPGMPLGRRIMSGGPALVSRSVRLDRGDELGLDLGEVAGLKVQAALASTPPGLVRDRGEERRLLLRADVLGLPSSACGSDGDRARGVDRAPSPTRRMRSLRAMPRATLMSGAAESSAWVSCSSSRSSSCRRTRRSCRGTSPRPGRRSGATPRSWATKMKASRARCAAWRAGSSPAPGSTRRGPRPARRR